MALTLQEIFDKSAAHLLKQGRQSITSRPNGKSCLYKDENGNMCAVGCLIKPELNDGSFEGASIAGVLRYMDSKIGSFDCKQRALLSALKASDINTNTTTLRLLSRLQRVHDACAVDSWPQVLGIVAEDLKLNTAVLESKP